MTFNSHLLRWFKKHGRHTLPWQINPTPYRVWVSEIMLQQTQVSTVIPYFERFMQQFPTIRCLSDAQLDEVLYLWAGLGYYSRAKNLHQTAQMIVRHYKGEFPTEYENILSLPGIGRSTAGAILSISMQQPYPILDGNVKRVLARHFAIEGWPGDPVINKTLWALSEEATPKKNVHHYTQAIMDLGATLCTPKNPQCGLCPVHQSCKAKAQDLIPHIPGKRPKQVLPQKSTQMLIILDTTHRVLLAKRPTAGIWGGLWSLLECPLNTDPKLWCKQHLKLNCSTLETLETFRHTFTHFHLDITPTICEFKQSAKITKNIRHLEAPYQWHALHTLDTLALPAPVKRLLTRVQMSISSGEYDVLHCAV